LTSIRIRALRCLLYGTLSHPNFPPSVATAIGTIVASLWANTFTVVLVFIAVVNFSAIRSLGAPKLALIMIGSLVALFVALHALLAPIGRKYLTQGQMTRGTVPEKQCRSGHVWLYHIMTVVSFGAVALWIKHRGIH
jgi:hypothetical protein